MVLENGVLCVTVEKNRTLWVCKKKIEGEFMGLWVVFEMGGWGRGMMVECVSL